MPVLPAAAKTSPEVTRRPPVVETGGERPLNGALRRAAAGPGVTVRLSPAGREALARSEVPPRIFDRVAEALGLEKEKLDAAGREEYLELIANAHDPREGDTAEPILGGILSFVYDAFRLEHPDPSQDELRGFVARAVRGTERGMHDAIELLRAFTSSRADLEAEGTRTLHSVREGLERFVENVERDVASLNGDTDASQRGVTSPIH